MQGIQRRINRDFNTASVSKLSFNRKKVEGALKRAKGKGLYVIRCSFKPGWTIRLPNETFHYEDTDQGMISYIEGY